MANESVLRMNLQHFNVNQCAEMPWKNGGGTTKEVVCHPANSDMSHFNWRISIAKIDQNGPFSSFEGIDRTIMLLQGKQVRLQAKDGSFDHKLEQPLAPFSFAGEVGLDCTLEAGSTQDFNVMTRRQICQSVTTIVREETTFNGMNTAVILAAKGRWSAVFNTAHETQLFTLDTLDGYWWASEDKTMTLSPLSDDAAMIVVKINEV